MGFLETLGQLDKAVIYGAQIYAMSVYGAIRVCFETVEIPCFLVTAADGNPKAIDGIPVYEVRKAPPGIKGCKILVATPEFFHREIAEHLLQLGFVDVVQINGRMQGALLRSYLNTLSVRRKIPRPMILEEADIARPSSPVAASFLHIYQACSVGDKPLAGKPQLPGWIEPIQAGSALSDHRICSLRDDEGVGISEKNRNYCELTAAYWIWKNRLEQSEYIGLCHYRRYLNIDPGEIRRMAEEKLEAVLPLPMLVYPDAWSHHNRFVEGKDWDRLMAVLRERYPEYYEAAGDIWRQKEFFLHNIWILRRDTADKFLAWMFDILFELENRFESCEGRREDRHMGYLGESLTTLYFLYHRKDMRIAYAREEILE